MKLGLNQDGLLDLIHDEYGGLVQDNSFESLILASLLLNRRASEGDLLPYGYRKSVDGLNDDRQGWVGDVFDARGRQVGSLLWLLANELATNETRDRAIQYIRQCLQHTIDDGHVSHLNFNPHWYDANRLDLGVDIYLTNGNVLSLRINYETGAIYAI